MSYTTQCQDISFLEMSKEHWDYKARNYKRKLLLWGHSSQKNLLVRTSSCLSRCVTDVTNIRYLGAVKSHLLHTCQLNYLKWFYRTCPRDKCLLNPVPFESTCPQPFLLVPENRIICFFKPCLLHWMFLKLWMSRLKESVLLHVFERKTVKVKGQGRQVKKVTFGGLTWTCQVQSVCLINQMYTWILHIHVPKFCAWACTNSQIVC